jgi:hypothetical protein
MGMHDGECSEVYLYLQPSANKALSAYKSIDYVRLLLICSGAKVCKSALWPGDITISLNNAD